MEPQCSTVNIDTYVDIDFDGCHHHSLPFQHVIADAQLRRSPVNHCDRNEVILRLLEQQADEKTVEAIVDADNRLYHQTTTASDDDVAILMNCVDSSQQEATTTTTTAAAGADTNIADKCVVTVGVATAPTSGQQLAGGKRRCVVERTEKPRHSVLALHAEGDGKSFAVSDATLNGYPNNELSGSGSSSNVGHAVESDELMTPLASIANGIIEANCE